MSARLPCSVEALGFETRGILRRSIPGPDRHFAPAVLSRWPIESHQLLDLPHPGLHGLRRVAVRARIRRPAGPEFEFVSVHFGTMREILPRQQLAQARDV